MMNSIANSNFDFYGYKTFYGGIGVVSALNLSGNFYVNKDVENWRDYHVGISANDIVISANDIVFNTITTQLSTENLTAYIDNGVIKTYNG